MINFKSLNKKDFLRDYWQKKPLIIKQGLAGFVDPIDENDLAGFAMEEDVDARVVSNDNDKWQLHQGPFEHFEAVCQGKWSLLVQGVDRLDEVSAQLLSNFDFIPMWRIEDLMVSFSVAGAGVGPHYDQYDVFIIQGKGTRRWKVGNKGQHQEVLPHPQLKQITPFTPILDHTLETGDILYIPPGFPHEGVAVEDCLNYSVGFRAPTQQELVTSFADYALEKDVFKNRYSDPDLRLRVHKNEIKLQEIAKFRELFSDMIASDHFVNWLTEFLSLPYENNEYFEENWDALDENAVADLIKQGAHFAKKSCLRHILIEEQNQHLKQRKIVIEGIPFVVPIEHLALVNDFLNGTEPSSFKKISYENSLFFSQFLLTLIKRGWCYPI